jgi:anti-sigma factor RsiW
MTPHDLELMAYHDGELSPRERARVAARLATDRAARQRLEELTKLRSAVRAWAETQSTRFDVSDHVMREISSGRAPRIRWVPAAVVVSVAAAAALVVVAQGPAASSGSFTPTTAGVTASGAGVPARSDEAPGARVESVDFGERSGSIFVLGSSAGTTTVIWMNDLPENRRRIDPL